MLLFWTKVWNSFGRNVFGIERVMGTPAMTTQLLKGTVKVRLLTLLWKTAGLLYTTCAGFVGFVWFGWTYFFIFFFWIVCFLCNLVIACAMDFLVLFTYPDSWFLMTGEEWYCDFVMYSM